MNEFVTDLAKRILFSKNIYPTRITDNSEVMSLINSLKPVSFGKELIRLGPNYDGGYLVPDDFEGIKACFSPGVDQGSGFELDCANMGMDVFLADKSVDAPPDCHKRFHFTKKFLGVTTDNDYMTLDDWVDSSTLDDDDELLLQIDIEGAEYEVFLSASNRLMKRFRIIVVEFHNLEQLWNKPFFDLASHAFYKLLQTHSCVHNHPNNCGFKKIDNIEIPIVTELTFLRKDRIKDPSYIKEFPHPLDFDNSDAPAYDLPECWYKTEESLPKLSAK